MLFAWTFVDSELGILMFTIEKKKLLDQKFYPACGFKVIFQVTNIRFQESNDYAQSAFNNTTKMREVPMASNLYPKHRLASGYHAQRSSAASCRHHAFPGISAASLYHR